MSTVSITPSALNHVAKMAAFHAVKGVTEQITDLVQYETMKVMPAVPPEAIQQLRSARYERGYVDMSASQPSSNYAQTLMRYAEWRKSRGERLGIIWLQKDGTRETLQVEQYGDYCAVLRRDDNQPHAKTDRHGMVTQPGKSCWTQFDPLPGHIDQVLVKLLARGWVVKQPTHKTVQLELVEGI